jgi:archaellum component FlaC
VKIFAAPRAVAEPVRVEARAVRVAGPDLDKKLDEINARLERIEKALEKLSD